MSKGKTIASLVLNLLIFMVTTGVVVSYFFGTSKIIRNGYECFMFFTTDSNVLAAVGALTVAICDVNILKGKTVRLPRAVTLLKYAGTVSVVLTFCTVMAFLVPIYGAEMQLTGTAFHMHLVAPMMALVSFVFFDPSLRMTKPAILAGMLPMVIYGTVYFTEVIIVKQWNDFYAFNQGGRWYVTMVIMFAVTVVLATLIRLIKNKCSGEA